MGRLRPLRNGRVVFVAVAFKMTALKVKWKVTLPFALMVVLAISMWPGVSAPMAHALGLFDGQNFSTAYALAFCAGVYFPKRLRWTLTLGMLVIVNMLTN